MQDRRQNERIDAHNVRLSAINVVDNQPLGIIGNLSADGLMLIVGQSLSPGGIVQMRVEATDDVVTPPIHIGARVLWCTPASSPQEYWAGLETIDIGDDDRQRVQDLLTYLRGQGT